MGKIIAIDYGLKRIGLAISDREKKIAFPLAIVEGGKKEVENIQKVLVDRKEELELIVIGLPLLLSGEKGEMAKVVEAFAEKLSAALKAPFFLLDERLSSRHAEVSMKELSLNRKKRSERVDLVAATLLLQSYLDGLKR